MRQLFLISTLVGLAAVSGCASVKETHAADGRKAFTLNCSGTARGWDKCMSAAGEICKSAGYDILDRNSEDRTTSGAYANFNKAGGSMGASSAKTNERTMLIACKSS